MNKLLLRWLASLWMLLVAPFSSSAPLTTAELVEAIKRNHPRLLAISASQQQAQQGVNVAEGRFDLRIEQQTKLKTSGYYDGKYLSQRVKKPLRFMGGELITEYRISDGDFASYDGELDTRSGGEASIGVAIPLLRDREIDGRRVALSNAKLGIDQRDAEAKWQINQLLYSGLSSYLDWYESKLRLAAIADLYDKTRIREKAIQTRVSKGDLAEISLTEFNAILLSRRANLQQARQEFAQSKQALSFFYRDDNGEMASADRLDDVPEDLLWPYADGTNTVGLEQKLTQHPTLASLQFSLEQAKNRFKLSSNAVLPQLDLEAKVARDIGAGNPRLGMVDSEVGLQFSLPLGQRSAKADKVIAEQKVKELQYELKLQQDSLKRDFNEAIVVLENTKQIAEFQQQQSETAHQLFLQEQKRFNVGVSNLFLLNTRETAAIEAQLKAIESEVAVLRQQLVIRYILAELS
jgi:outer membrane protein TolC